MHDSKSDRRGEFFQRIYFNDPLRINPYHTMTTRVTEKNTYIASFKVVLSLLCILFFANISETKGQGVFSVDEAYKADSVVYVTDYEYQADLEVFKTAYQYQYEFKNGIWYFVDEHFQASNKIYITERKYEADLTIYYIEEKYQAGEGE